MINFYKILKESVISENYLFELRNKTKNARSFFESEVKKLKNISDNRNKKYGEVDILIVALRKTAGKFGNNIAYIIGSEYKRNTNNNLLGPKFLNYVIGLNEQTEYQKYIGSHKNSHEQSLGRTLGLKQNQRKHQNFVPNVRKDKINPYKSDVANIAEKAAKILTPIDMQELKNIYNIDFSDRRVKTIKGKTGMILTPLPNGSWQLSHK